MTSPTRTLELYADFDCTGCGECCRDWRIHVDKPAYDRAVALLATGAHPGRIASPEAAFTLAETQTDEAWAVLKTDEGGYCAFLDDDNLCYWHKHFGYETKGWVCRTFPNESYATPTSLTLTGSLSCRPMAELLRDRHTGPARIIEAPEGFAASAHERQQWTVLPGAAIWIKGERLMEAEAMDMVQSALMEFVGAESLPLSARLRMGRLFLQQLHDMSTPGTPLSVEAVRDYFELIEADATPLYLKAAVQEPHPTLLAHAVRVFFARMARVGMPQRRAAAFEAYIEALQLNSPPELLALHLQRLHEAHFDTAVLGPILTAYAGHRLFRSQAIPRGGLIPGFTEVLTSLLLVWAISLAIAARRGAPVDEDTLIEAIHSAELTFFHSPVFEAFLGNEAGLDSIHTSAFAGILTAPFD